MAIRIEEDLIRDLELEASRRHVPLAEIIRDALQIWRANHKAPTNDRERIIQVLQEKGLLCQSPTELAAGAQPLAIEELDRLAAKVAEGGPLSELIVQERRGEV